MVRTNWPKRRQAERPVFEAANCDLKDSAYSFVGWKLKSAENRLKFRRNFRCQRFQVNEPVRRQSRANLTVGLVTAPAATALVVSSADGLLPGMLFC